MADFVLVHGAWHGAWCWRRLLPGLWQAGHRAFAVDLTGLGARRHLFRPELGLSDHVADVVQTLDNEELAQAVLVGHSYAGMVVTGAADQRPAQVSTLVYLDAVVPEPGEAWSSTHPPATRAERRSTIAAQGGLPPPDPAAFGLQGDDHAWVQRQLGPQPGGCYDEPLTFDAGLWSARRRVFIDCNSPALPTIASSRVRAQTQPGWELHSLSTGHDPMVSAPEDLLAVLLSLPPH
jgi:pimeloyl-ACP methyl ester carboxylesterase